MPHLWVRGSLAGLTLALAFSVLLNVLVLATLVWPAWLPPRLRLACAATAVGLWIAALWETRGELRRLAAERDADVLRDPEEPKHEENANDALLRDAQQSYLAGDLVAAERTLRRAARRDRDDFEARFWLATVHRRSGRLSRAKRLLGRLERLDAAVAWRHELADERRRIDEAETGRDNPAANRNTTPDHREPIEPPNASGSATRRAA